MWWLPLSYIKAFEFYEKNRPAFPVCCLYFNFVSRLFTNSQRSKLRAFNFAAQ